MCESVTFPIALVFIAKLNMIIDVSIDDNHDDDHDDDDLSVNLLQAVCQRGKRRVRQMKAESGTDQTEQTDPIQRN